MTDRQEQPTLHDSNAGALKTAFRWVCPHWWRALPSPLPNEMIKTEKEEICHLCGKIRIRAILSEPHPTRDKKQLVKDLQNPPHYELIVTDWRPYGTYGPKGERTDE